MRTKHTNATASIHVPPPHYDSAKGLDTSKTSGDQARSGLTPLTFADVLIRSRCCEVAAIAKPKRGSVPGSSEGRNIVRNDDDDQLIRLGGCPGISSLRKFIQDNLSDAGFAEVLAPNGRSTGDFSIPCAREILVRSLYFFRSTLEVLYDRWTGEGKLDSFDFLSQLSLLKRALRWTSDHFEKNAKYFLTRPMAQYLRQTLPDCPPDSYGPLDGSAWLLFTGSVKKYLKNRLVAFNSKNTQLFQGFLQGIKRGCYVVSEDLVQATYAKHRAALSKEKPANVDQTFDEDPTSFSFYLNRIIDTLFPCSGAPYNKGVNPDFPKSFEYPKELPEPSTSASYGTKRSTGGGRQAVLDFLEKEKLWVGGVAGRGMASMVEVEPGDVRTNEALDNPTFKEVIDHVSRFFLLEPLHKVVPPRTIGVLNVSWMRDMFHRNIEDETTEPFEGQAQPRPTLSGATAVHAVLEPLKVRLISKGEPIKYWLSKPFQKFLWAGLQNSKIFELTGKTMEESVLYQLIQEDGEFWVSGDYSAATDGVRMQWTIEALERVMERTSVPHLYRRILRRVLYGQLLEYPSGSDLRSVMQATGQLMGSTLSFPILCIINLAAYWQNLERHEGPKSLDELKVRINGDDILFHSPGDEESAFYRGWLQSVEEAGFTLSPGKNYVHPRYLTVNSQGYVYNPETRTFKQIPFLNVGLLIGKAKTAKSETTSLLPPAARFDAVVSGSFSPARSQRRFIHYNRATVESATKGGLYSLFMDPLLGGIGCTPRPGLDVRYTPFQRKIAAYLYRNLVEPKSGVYTKPKMHVSLVLDGQNSTGIPRYTSKRTGYFEWCPKYDVPRKGDTYPMEPLTISNQPLTRVFDRDDRPTYRARYLPRQLLNAVRKDPHPIPHSGWSKLHQLSENFRHVRTQRRVTEEPDSEPVD